MPEEIEKYLPVSGDLNPANGMTLPFENNTPTTFRRWGCPAVMLSLPLTHYFACGVSCSILTELASVESLDTSISYVPVMVRMPEPRSASHSTVTVAVPSPPTATA